VCRSWC